MIADTFRSNNNAAAIHGAEGMRMPSALQMLLVHLHHSLVLQVARLLLPVSQMQKLRR